jgi:hypothetical protein
MDFTVRAISMTVFFWAWARGLDGAMDTAGADTALAVAAAEDLTVVLMDAGRVADIVMLQRVVDLQDTSQKRAVRVAVVHQQCAAVVVMLRQHAAAAVKNHAVAVDKNVAAAVVNRAAVAAVVAVTAGAAAADTRS